MYPITLTDAEILFGDMYAYFWNLGVYFVL